MGVVNGFTHGLVVGEGDGDPAALAEPDGDGEDDAEGVPEHAIGKAIASASSGARRRITRAVYAEAAPTFPFSSSKTRPPSGAFRWTSM